MLASSDFCFGRAEPWYGQVWQAKAASLPNIFYSFSEKSGRVQIVDPFSRNKTRRIQTDDRVSLGNSVCIQVAGPFSPKNFQRVQGVAPVSGINFSTLLPLPVCLCFRNLPFYKWRYWAIRFWLTLADCWLLIFVLFVNHFVARSLPLFCIDSLCPSL